MSNNIVKLLCLLCFLAGSARADFLDYGLYWFGKDQASEKYTGPGNRYYDDGKPTLIFVHGWQLGTSKDNYWRPNFNFQNNAPAHGYDIDEAAAWIDQGWNVGIYYWNQFADELEVKDAEAKMWTATGPRGMRYRQSDGSYSTLQAPEKSISELMTDAIAEALKNNRNGYLLLHGHSLGNQLAISVAYGLTRRAEQGIVPASMIPERLVLSDPFWSKFGKNYLNDAWTGEISRAYARYLIDHYDIALEMTRSSGICDLWIGDCNEEMTRLAAFQRLRFWYSDWWEIDQKHIMAYDWWMLSRTYPAPLELNENLDPTGENALSASTSDQRIKAMMGGQYEWDQVDGLYTSTPADDRFEVIELSY
ncbi:hypothetical protein [Gynuella sunshinyii]|uniref:Uncharacterized protein n=1 Tax=Gynuella sunshinyii YC6258 TaxID=1445510 RepID=A0A0C5VRL1_9GAMM|nr:hypothetical protein [Gynuella sunshinyii]AJQ92909.1 hypothetical Protein YC6258_00859 [Gynuella sunshinyii YC6258]